MAIRTIADTFAKYDEAVAGFKVKFERFNEATNATIEQLKVVRPRGELNRTRDAERDEFLSTLQIQTCAIRTGAKTFIASFSFIDCTDSQAQLIKDEANKTDHVIQAILDKIVQRRGQPKETVVQEQIDLKPYQIGQQFRTDLEASKTQNTQRAIAIDGAFRQVLERANRMLGEAQGDRVVNADLKRFNEQKKKLQYHTLSLNLAIEACKSLNQRQKDFFKKTQNAILIVLDNTNKFIVGRDSELNNRDAKVLKSLDLDAQDFEKNIRELLQSSSPTNLLQIRQGIRGKADQAQRDAEQDPDRRLMRIEEDLQHIKKAAAETAKFQAQQEEGDLYMSVAPDRDETTPLITGNNPDRNSCCCFGF